MIKLSKLLFESAITNDEGFWGDMAAGILVFAQETKKFLILKRANWVNEPGTWGLAGGASQPGESPSKTARREAEEELGEEKEITRLIPAYVFTE